MHAARNMGANLLAAGALVALCALVPGALEIVVGVTCTATATLVVAGAVSRMSAAARPSSSVPVERDDSYRPKVSVLVTSKDEPASVVIRSIAALRRLDYPDYEVLVINSNSTDRENYETVSRYVDSCPDTFRFVHVDEVRGFKAGALNYLNGHCVSDDSVVEAIVDCDYLVDPDFLERTVGYFRDERVGLVQAPQDYRGVDGRNVGLYYEYRSFFGMVMHQAQRLGLVSFTGTMGLVRTSLVRQGTGWDEGCITEDAEAGARINSQGSIGVYVDESLGRGYMPFDYGNLVRQRRRWVYGNMQVLSQGAGKVLADRRLGVRRKTAFVAQTTAWFQPELVVAELSTLSLLLWHATGARPYGTAGVMMLDLLAVCLISSCVTFLVGLRRDAAPADRARALLAHYGLLSVMSTAWLLWPLGYRMGFSVTKKVPEGHARTTVPVGQVALVALLVACALLGPWDPGVVWRGGAALATAALAAAAVPYANRMFVGSSADVAPAGTELMARPASGLVVGKDGEGR